MAKYLLNERKEMEEPVEMIEKLQSFKYFEKKRKYPFHEKIDLKIDPAIKSIFDETYNIISSILDENKQKKRVKMEQDPPQKSFDEQVIVNYDDIKIDDDENNDEEEKAVFVSKPSKLDHYTATLEELEIFPLPLRESEIRKEISKSMEFTEIENEFDQYQEKLIEVICNQFERIYFRSPSLEEIALILSKSMQKMEKYDKTGEINNCFKQKLTPNQALFADDASKGKVVNLLESAEIVVLEYLKKKIKANKPNQQNKEMIINVLMSRIRQNGFFLI